MNFPCKIAILIFDDVEVLDFCGPFEVFSITKDNQEQKAFKVMIAAENEAPVLTRNQLSINPHYTITNCPAPDILLIPGGPGTRREMGNDNLLNWIKSCSKQSKLTLSVCTGSLLLGKANLLDGLEITTHHGALDLLKEVVPNAVIRKDKRIIDNGKFIVSGGISAGIDMSLYVVAKLLGKDVAMKTAEYMEYRWLIDDLGVC